MVRYPVQEIFGPTIQGEGMLIGQKCLFLRLAGCDYACTWCDSMYTWSKDHLAPIESLEAEEILARLEQLRCGCSLITISGGNPALHDLSQLIGLLQNNGYAVNIETQGSKVPSWIGHADMVTISPKPYSSGMTTDWMALRNCIESSIRPCLKVVVFDDLDYEYAVQVHREFPAVPLSLQVGNRMGTDARDDLLASLSRLVAKVAQDERMDRVSVLPQLHVLLWGNKRGV